MKNYQILERRNSGRVKKASRAAVPLMVPVAQLAEAAREGVQSLMDRLGLAVMELAVGEERSRLTESPERVGHKWGSQPGYAFLGGRKVPFANQRVRSYSGDEVRLESYQRFQEDASQGRVALRDMLRGVSTRDYREGVEGLMRGYGVDKSSVSRQFVRASARRLRELLEQDLSALDLVALMVDGIGFAGNLLVVALGVDSKGNKHPLGIWQGATENATVCQALLDDLIRRGLDAQKRYLFVLDGGKGLRSAVQKTFGDRGEVQRCHEHKKRNVSEHLPPHRQAEFRRRMSAAYDMLDYSEAKTALSSCVRDLERINPSAAASLREGLEETLTLHRLELPDALRTSLSTTNPIESPFAYVREKTVRVKRWRDGDQAQRWAASALLKAKNSWRKIKGHALLPALLKALCRRETGQQTNG
jgi:transposase-like protein